MGIKSGTHTPAQLKWLVYRFLSTFGMTWNRQELFPEHGQVFVAVFDNYPKYYRYQYSYNRQA